MRFIHILYGRQVYNTFHLACGPYYFKIVDSPPVDALFKMSLAQIIIKIRERALLADILLNNSGELLKFVVEVGVTVGGAADTLNAAVLKLDQTNNYNSTDTEATKARIKQTAVNTAKGVVQLSAQSAIRIRRVIGWNDHPYLPEQRNGGATLIGIELALNQLSLEMIALTSAWVWEKSFTEVCQRISVIALAAEKNTRTATANVVAVEAVGALAIKIARAS